MAKFLHIHSGGRPVHTVLVGRRRSFFDADPAFEAREAIIEALLAELERMHDEEHGRSTTHDDGGAQQGHPFYGNQYTDVAGSPKPTEAKNKKSVKAALHELLVSGHPFSLDELMAATGSKSKSNLTTAITHLKGANPHELGVLNILKNAKGEYHLDKNQPPGLDPYVPKPKAKAAETPGSSQDPTALGAAKAEAATAPPPAPAASAGPVAKAPSTPFSKGAADEVYQEKLDAINEEVAADMMAGADPLKAAEKWKSAKASAMAQWKANTTGVDQKPLPVSVFAEDVQLVKDLHAAAESEQPTVAYANAVGAWKAATHKAKMEAMNKPAPTPVAPPPAAPKPVVTPVAATTPTGPSVFKAPEAIVPKDWKGIDSSDFHQNAYEQNISHVHKALHAASKDAIGNKITVQQGLEKRLAASHHFQAMAEQHKKLNPNGNGLAAAIISQWAGSSGDHHDASVSAQLAIRDAFNMSKADTEHKAFGSLESKTEDQVHKNAAQQYDINVNTPEKLESFKAGMRDFALAQYHETQDKLASMGIKELHLIRGMKVGAAASGAKKVKVKLQPASSFSTDHGTAHQFAGSGSLFVVKVPASQVLGSFLTGYGCTHESEVVVLNHPGMEAIQVGKSNAPNATSMASHIKQTLPSGAKPATPAATKPASATPKAKAAWSKGLPNLPTNATGGYASKAKKALADGDLDLFHQIAASVPTGKKITQGYIDALKAHIASHS